jgi:hypothetical protein
MEKDTRRAHEESPSESTTPSLREKSLDFLIGEHESLKRAYSDVESSVQGLFNFYLTIFSAVVGAGLFIIQVDSVSAGTISVLLTFVIAVGIFYQSGIIGKYADQVVYATAIEEIRNYLIKKMPEAGEPLRKLPLAPKLTAEHSAVSRLDRWEMGLWWLLPVGTHQLFIAFVNSLSLAVLVWMFLSFLGISASHILGGSIVSFATFWLSIIANDSYATIKLRQEMAIRGVHISTGSRNKNVDSTHQGGASQE